MNLWLVLLDDTTEYSPTMTFGPVDWVEVQSPTRIYAVSKPDRYGNTRGIAMVHDARGWHRAHETVGPTGNRITFVRRRPVVRPKP